MADIAAGDVTITIVKNRMVKGSPGSLQRNIVKIAFGDGALTYPSGGVPLPTYPNFGMRRELEFLFLFDNNDGSGLVWKYDYENKKLRAWVTAGGDGDPFTAAALIEASGAVAAQVMYAEAVGW